jgi:hypothetical protein
MVTTHDMYSRLSAHSGGVSFELFLGLGLSLLRDGVSFMVSSGQQWKGAGCDASLCDCDLSADVSMQWLPRDDLIEGICFCIL